MNQHDSGRLTPPKKPKIAFLLVAAILSAAIAWGFFMDPIIAAGLGALGLPPPRIQLPEWSFSELMGGEAQTNSPTDPDGQSPQRPWWEGLFGNVIPDVEHSVEISTPPPEDWPQTDPLDYGESWPSREIAYYSEEDMIALCYEPFVKALSYLEALQYDGQIPPIESVGLFDLDLNGVPEIITVSRLGGYVEYAAYELYSVERLTSWSWEANDNGVGELMLWETTASAKGYYGSYCRTLLMHQGNGDDNIVCEISHYDLVCKELFAQIQDEMSWSGSWILYQFRMNGETTDEKTYFEAYDLFKQTNTSLYETRMITVEWNGADQVRMAKKILESGQMFAYAGK